METLGAFWDGESPPRAQLPVARPSGRLRCGAATLHGRQPLPPLLGARATFGGLHTAPTLRAVQLTAPPDSPGAARQPLAESKPRRRVPGSRAEAAPPPHDPEPVFWEIALVWSLSKNDSQRARKRKQAEAAAAGAPAAEPDSDEEEMLRSPTWKDVREALLGAGLSVRMLRSKDADDFFMAVGGTLSALQAEAERCGFELRLRAKEGGALADRPMPFFAYQRAQDAHYERFEEARAGGAKRGARAAADAELGGATAARGPPFASIERQRLMEGAINRALLQRCDLNLTQLRNLSNACHDFLYLHAEDERQLVEECLGSHSSGCRLPAPSDLRAYKLGALEPARRYLGEQVRRCPSARSALPRPEPSPQPSVQPRPPLSRATCRSASTLPFCASTRARCCRPRSSARPPTWSTGCARTSTFCWCQPSACCSCSGRRCLSSSGRRASGRCGTCGAWRLSPSRRASGSASAASSTRASTRRPATGSRSATPTSP